MNNMEKNNKMLAEGETLPCAALKNTTKVQKSTVAAMLHNISIYNTGIRGAIETELEASIPALAQAWRF